MIVDTSALIAILLSEPDAPAIAERLGAAASKSMSAATLVEAGIVAMKRVGGDDEDALLSLVRQAGIAVVPVDETLAVAAIDAYRSFGKSSGHPARLNFGDCFSYALAKARNEPLLYKGDDFASTDVAPAL